jgi:two-component system, OmpR family, sensor kinase
MSSLRARLFLSLTVITVVTALIGGGLAFRWAFREAIELQDSILDQIAVLTDNARFQDNALDKIVVDSDARFIIRELDASGAETINPRSLRDLPDGLHNVQRDDRTWRFLIKTRKDGSRVAIGQSTEIRDEIARDNAFRTIAWLAVLVPCLMLVAGFVIRQTFRPVARLAARLDIRQSDHLERLPLEGIPTELRPFVASINRLLQRVGTMVDQQRRFVADASHELRSPITALSLQAENLLQTEFPPQSRDRLAALKQGTRRTAHLLDQLLTLARYDMGPLHDPPAMRLDQCVRDVVSDLLPRARERNIDLGFESIEAISVRCEPVALGIMIRNLVDNALRYSHESGRVDIGLRCKGACAILQIEDTGPGVSEADLEHIFEPFFRGQRSANDGTGLGLSIVSRIVERSHGSIRLENIGTESRAGLRVIVSLPIVG